MNTINLSNQYRLLQILQKVDTTNRCTLHLLNFYVYFLQLLSLHRRMFLPYYINVRILKENFSLAHTTYSTFISNYTKELNYEHNWFSSVGKFRPYWEKFLTILPFAFAPCWRTWTHAIPQNLYITIKLYP